MLALPLRINTLQFVLQHHTLFTISHSWEKLFLNQHIPYYSLSSQTNCRPWWLSCMLVILVIKRLRVRPLSGWQHSFVEIGQEIFSTVILTLQLIQEGQLSVTGEKMCTILVTYLENYRASLPNKSVVK